MRQTASVQDEFLINCQLASVKKLYEMIGYLKKALDLECNPEHAQRYRSAKIACNRIWHRMLQEYFNERAAIRQFQGGYSLARSEDLAYDDTLRHFGIRDLPREKQRAESLRRLYNLIELLDPKPSQIALELDRICSASSATPLLPAL